MKPMKMKKIVLVLGMIVTLLAPNVCVAVEPLTNTEVPQELESNSTEKEATDENNQYNEIIEESDKENITQNQVAPTEEEVKPEEIKPEEVEQENSASLETTVMTAEETEKVQNEQESQTVGANYNTESTPKAIATRAGTTQVKPGKETLQEAIQNAEPGSTLQLQIGDYTGTDIVIDKDITIRGAGMGGVNSTDIIPKITIQTKDGEKCDVTLENFATYNQPPKDGFVYFDIKTPVNLKMNKVMIFHILRDVSKVDDINSIAINLEKNTSNSTIDIKDSIISTSYEDIICKSSDNTINLNKTKLQGRLAFKLEDGSNNKINIENGSDVSGRSSYSYEDEAISIIEQKNLEIKINDSIIRGTDAKGNNTTHLFSFDGERPSQNVHISITGNSSVEDIYGGAGSSIFNFGKSNTANNSNSVYIANTVTLTPNTVANKYNTDNDYAMVGIFDENRNLTIKAYDKGKPIEELKTRPETIEGCTWDKKIEEDTTQFNIDDPVTENMDLYPVMPVTLDVHVNENTYKIPEGKSMKDMYEKYPELKADIEEMKQKEGFRRFVDQDGAEINEETQILKETTVTPKYTVTVKITAGEETQSYELEEGQFLGDITEKVEKYEQTTEKRFDKYVQVNNEENVLTNNSIINEDIEIKPIYVVDVKINEETYTIEEGKTLNDLSNEDKEKINTNVNVENKIFTQLFKNEEDNYIDYDTQINKHTTLTPKYNVEIIIEKFGGQTKRYEIAEGSTLADSLSEEEIRSIQDFITVDTKTFDKYVDDNGQQVYYSTPITENTHFLAVYRDEITITIVGKDSNKVYTIETGENLNSLEEAVIQEIMEAVKQPNKELSHFVDSENNEVDFTTSIQKTTTLTPKYKVKVTVKPKYYSQEIFEMPEGSKLSTLNDDLAKFENKDNKEFKKYTNEAGDADISKDTTYNENVTIVPKYEITITVQPQNGSSKEIKKVAEGSKLNDINEQLTEFEDSKVTNKEFDKYVDVDGNPIAKEDKILTENTTIIPKYNIKVTIKKADNSTKEYFIAEETVLHRLPDNEMTDLRTFVSEPDKIFADSFKDEQNNEVGLYTVLNENITLTPKYNVKVTINDKDGNQLAEVILPEGESLSTKSDELNAVEKLENKTFVGYYDGETEVKVSDEIKTNKTLVAKYNVKVTINDKDGNQLTEVTLPEGETLSTKSSELNDIENPENKTFAGYYDGESKVGVSDEIRTNKTLVAKYSVDVKIGNKTYSVSEGETLAELKALYPDAEQALENIKDANRKFSRYVDEKSNTIDDNTVFNENTNISSKYLVTVTIYTSNGESQEFNLEEGKTLSDLSDKDKEQLQGIKNNPPKGLKFVEFKDAQTDEIITDTTQITGDITLIEVYEEVPEEQENTEQKQDTNNPEKEATSNETTNPGTSDKLMSYIIFAIIGLGGMIVSIKLYKKK